MIMLGVVEWCCIRMLLHGHAWFLMILLMLGYSWLMAEHESDKTLLYLLNPSLCPVGFISQSCLLLLVFAWIYCCCYAVSHVADWWLSLHEVLMPCCCFECPENLLWFVFVMFVCGLLTVALCCMNLLCAMPFISCWLDSMFMMLDDESCCCMKPNLMLHDVDAWTAVPMPCCYVIFAGSLLRWWTHNFAAKTMLLA